MSLVRFVHVSDGPDVASQRIYVVNLDTIVSYSVEEEGSPKTLAIRFRTVSGESLPPMYFGPVTLEPGKITERIEEIHAAAGRPHGSARPILSPTFDASNE